MDACDVKKNSQQPKVVEEKVSFPPRPSPASPCPPGGSPCDHFLVPLVKDALCGPVPGNPYCISSCIQMVANTQIYVCVCVCLVTQSCPTLCDPLDYSLPGSSVHGIFGARILEQVAISFSRRSSQPRDQTYVSCMCVCVCVCVFKAMIFPVIMYVYHVHDYMY